MVNEENTNENERTKKSLVNRIYGNPIQGELGSTATLAGIGVAGMHTFFSAFPDAVENLRYSLGNARHAGKTVSDAASGGPEGYRAVKNLEDALEIVQQAADGNQQAAQALDNYVTQRKDFAEELAGIYRENETIETVASRLKIQLEGTLKNFFEVGNDIKGETWRNIDDAIARLYGKDPTEARESSGRLNEFYKNVKDFYDTREQNEHTVKEFCDYLAETQSISSAQNAAFEELYPSVISRVKEGYELEEDLFTVREKVKETGTVLQNDLDALANNQEFYDTRVENTQESVGQQIPMAPYNSTTWVDYVVDPITLGVAAGVLAKGATKMIPHLAEAPLRYVLATPTRLAGNFLGGALNGASVVGKNIYEKSGLRRLLTGRYDRGDPKA